MTLVSGMKPRHMQQQIAINMEKISEPEGPAPLYQIFKFREIVV